MPNGRSYAELIELGLVMISWEKPNGRACSADEGDHIFRIFRHHLAPPLDSYISPIYSHYIPHILHLGSSIRLVYSYYISYIFPPYITSWLLEGDPKKMHHKDSDLKSVLEVRFYFSTCVSESEFRARVI